MNFKVSIKVPATSANLGPGFDILGLALTLYNEFLFTVNSKSKFQTEMYDGSSLPFSNTDDLLLDGYKQYYSIFLKNQKLIAYDVKMKLDLPLKGGLGSSASALACGFKFANYVHQKFYSSESPIPDQKTLLYELAKIEGHPDNTTPAYLGGLILAYFHEEELIHFKHKFPKKIALFLFIPEIEISTHDSRKKLPDQYSISDSIFNMARLGTWLEFLQLKKYSLLKLAVQDKLHSDYRIESVPVLKKVSEIILSNDACFSLSGSGPTLLIYLKESKSSKQIQKIESEIIAANLTNLKFKIKKIKIDLKGIQIKEL